MNSSGKWPGDRDVDLAGRDFGNPTEIALVPDDFTIRLAVT